MKPWKIVIKRSAIGVALLSMSIIAIAQDKNSSDKPKMKFMGAYDAGQPGVSIYKMFDPTEDVVCYVLMPEVASRRQAEGGKWVYEGNTVGSISCLKVRVPVVPINPQQSK